MDSDTKDVIDRLFDTTLDRFQQTIETSNDNGSGFTNESVGLLFYYFMKIDIRRAKSYVKSHESIANKETTINPKNEKGNNCFQWSTTLGLTYNN